MSPNANDAFKPLCCSVIYEVILPVLFAAVCACQYPSPTSRSYAPQEILTYPSAIPHMHSVIQLLKMIMTMLFLRASTLMYQLESTRGSRRTPGANRGILC